MLLATALSLVLLSGLWALFQTYTRLFDKGQSRVEEAQLVRSLMEQIATDLQSAIQDPIGGAPQPGAELEPQRRFGLFGTAGDLRIDVLQLTPQRANTTPVGARGFPDSPDVVARVPELRTVHYRMASDPLAADDQQAGSRGLVRQEMDFESPAEPADATLPEDGGPVDQWSDVADAEQDGFQADWEVSAAAADDTWLSVPEVAAISFRYFDGTSWTSSWNSIQRKSLPAAVEVQLQLAAARNGVPGAAVDQPTAADAAADLDQAELSAGEVELAGIALPGAATLGPSYRLVVDLPGSPQYGKSRVEAPPAEPRPSRPAVRRIAPPRWTPQKKAPSRGTDQWIRTGSP
jgi:hypothetical protein